VELELVWEGIGMGVSERLAEVGEDVGVRRARAVEEDMDRGGGGKLAAL